MAKTDTKAVTRELTELVSKCALDLLFELATWKEKLCVQIKAGFDTACWVYRNPVHHLFIGDGLFTDPNGDRFCRPDYDKKKYVKNHIVHEQGHGECTERDPKKIEKLLKAIECPFPLYNLFEDARMEEFMRKRHGYAFEWLSMEVMGVERKNTDGRPESILFSLIQAEGDASKVEAACAANPVFADKFETVREFYAEIVAQKSSVDLFPILERWLEKFPLSEEDKQRQAQAGASDLELGAKLSEDDAAFAEFIKSAVAVSGSKDSGTAQDKLSGLAKQDEDFCSEVAAKGNLLVAESDIPLDTRRVRKIADKFRQFLTPKVLKVATSDPQKRFSARRALLKLPPYLKKKEEGPGIKKFVMVIDVSGSMGGAVKTVNGRGTHISEGVLIAAALSELARQQLVEGHIILSGVVNGGPTWQTFRLPMREAELRKISAFAGAEGLEYAMKSNQQLLIDAHEVLVYTDGQICDRSVDKKYFHQRGVFTWGLYVGNQGDLYMPKLLEYFDKGCIRESAEELIDFMLAQKK